MVKNKISKKQKAYSKKELTLTDDKIFHKHDPLENLLDKKIVIGAIAECVKENDFEGIVEIIQIYMRALKRSKSVQQVESAAEMHGVDYGESKSPCLASSRQSNSSKKFN